MKIPRPRMALAAGTVLALACLLLLLPAVRRFLFGPPAGPRTILVSGNIEAHQSILSFTDVEAPIVYLPFDEGRFVRAGTVLARVEARLYRQQLRIDRGNLQVARAQVLVDQSNYRAAQKTVLSDRFNVTQTRRDYIRATRLIKAGAISRQAYDQAYTTAAQASAALARDQALLQVARDNVSLARAGLVTAKARVGLDRVTLSYTTLRAPFSGVLGVREAELGELAGPGVAIFTLDDLDHVWLRAYVNERDLGAVRLGEPATVTTDTYPGKKYHGRISFISSEAQFTPKTVETHAERVTLVYRIRIDIDNPTHELLPGMPADARIALLPPGP
ncbi:MAG: efflux RND transporter periplasmic adaptor subunit [Gammaproteobacteria bacterium]|nr:efflux RND transporter periplasmic adaptor subunit [Gammaproteobacteria bacterium]